eukprot:TRINITY_DN6920_c0_g1_i1.p1 TRINITY_DN6920_c0_g1~~TRINITY_DN6920_c0_g1_i1.p1  ORF type:complete len:644 (+),score=56.85 TRINITY_DN6920_c0_g1_i1:230-1933(+)
MGGWTLGAIFYVYVVGFSFAVLLQGGIRVDDYRNRVLLLAQVRARRKAPVPPSRRLQLPASTPFDMGNDIWDEIMRHLETPMLVKLSLSSRYFQHAALLSMRRLGDDTSPFGCRIPEDQIAFILRKMSHHARLTTLRVHTSKLPYYPELLENCSLIPSLRNIDIQCLYSSNPDPAFVQDMRNILVDHGSWMATRLTNLSLVVSRDVGDLRGLELLGTFSKLKQLKVEITLPRSVIQNLKCIEELECGLEDDVLDSDKPILSTTLRTLRLWNGRLPPILNTLPQLEKLKIEYFDDKYWEREPEWENLENLPNLVEFKWQVDIDEEYRPESLFAREISSRLPHIRRTNLRFTVPGNTLVFTFLETLSVNFRRQEEILQLLTLCREQNKLQFLKRFKQRSKAMIYFEPAIWDALVSPTFLWPRLESLELWEWNSIDLNSVAPSTWRSFCHSLQAAQATRSFSSLVAPMTVADLNVIADSFSENLQYLEIFLPDIDKKSAEVGNDFLNAISRFPNLRKVKARPSLKHSANRLLECLLPLQQLEEIGLGLSPDISKEIRWRLRTLPNLKNLW